MAAFVLHPYRLALCLDYLTEHATCLGFLRNPRCESGVKFAIPRTCEPMPKRPMRALNSPGLPRDPVVQITRESA